MLKKLVILVFFIGATPNYSTQICQEQILRYQQKYSSDYFFPRARTEHILNLLNTSNNNLELINNIFMHYMSIKLTNYNFALSLEECLLDLLKISRKNIKEESAAKYLAQNIINRKFWENNKKNLEILNILSQEEQKFFTCARPKKADFDNVIYNEPGLEVTPAFVRALTASSDKIMKVYYEGHDVFYKHNINLVRDFIVLFKNSPAKNSAQKALDFYAAQLSPGAFNNIKTEVRKI